MSASKTGEKKNKSFKLLFFQLYLHLHIKLIQKNIFTCHEVFTWSYLHQKFKEESESILQVFLLF